jgi:hypothetical protein
MRNPPDLPADILTDPRVIAHHRDDLWLREIVGRLWGKIAVALRRRNVNPGLVMPKMEHAGAYSERVPLGRVTFAPQDIDDSLGCGSYGCVYNTNDVDTVCKVTTDESELDFMWAYAHWKDSRMLDGIVRYWKDGAQPLAFLLPAALTGHARPMFIFWRARADVTGLKAVAELYELARRMGGTQAVRMFTNHLMSFRNRAASNYWFAKKVREEFADDGRYVAWLRAQLDRASELARSENFGRAGEYQMADAEWLDTKNFILNCGPGKRRFQKSCFTLPPHIKSEDAFAYNIAALDSVARMMASGDYALGAFNQIGRALWESMSQGVLICDAHGGNLGLVGGPKDYVIVDAGWALPLLPQWIDGWKRIEVIE